MANNKGSDYRGHGKAYTLEENRWLIENIDNYDYPELTRLFNDKFNRNLKSVSDHCIKSLKLHKNFNRGNYSKGRKDFIDRLPIGTERLANRGEVYIKISDKYIEGRTPTIPHNPNYKLKKEIIWESVHGIKPKGSIIVFLDMDKHNFDINNLYCIPRKIGLMISKNKWWSTNRDITLAAIKWCELYYSLNRKEIDIYDV